MKKQSQFEQLFRSNYGKLTANLVSAYGSTNLDKIENAVMEAYYKAMKIWPFKGTPDNPPAWLYRVAKNSLIDSLRKANKSLSYENGLQQEFEEEINLDQFEIKDPELKLLFLICHPEIKANDRLAFMLKTISGFGDKEISNALMIDIETIKKRLQRARREIKSKALDFSWPKPEELNDRIGLVHKSLYLLFKEGFYSSHPELWTRKDLCIEAMRLTKYLSEHALANGQTYALMSLMCYHISRYESRLDKNGDIILLKDQDRNKWDQYFIKLGGHFLEKSAEMKSDKSKYQIEAFISAQHCMAKDLESTNWNLLKELYEELYRREQSDVIRLNLILVNLQLDNVAEAKVLFDKIKVEKLKTHKIVFYMIGVELYKKLQDDYQIQLMLEKALNAGTNEKYKQVIETKLKEISNKT